MHTHSRRAERGVALLLVLIAIVLMAALATELTQTATTQGRLGRSAMNDFLLRTAAEGRMHILRASLRYDATNGDNVDTEDDDWAWSKHTDLSDWGERSATGVPEGGEDSVAYSNTDVQLVAWCEDERSKLNLTGLSRPEDSPEYRNTRETLLRLIDEFRDGWSSLDLSESDAQEMVDDLTEWLRDQSEDDANPIPPVASGRGRLQSVDDLLRVPGGKWKREILYAVKDVDVDPDAESDDLPETADGEWRRPNGVPGLVEFLTVHLESGGTPALRINVNTAPKALLRALFDERDRELGDAIVDHRREGAGETDDTGSGTGDSSGDGAETGYFKTKADLTKVEGMAESLDEYPRLNYFADTRSDVYSCYVIASMVTGTYDADPDADPDDEDAGPRDIEARLQRRDVVQRTEQGFITLYSEIRHDPVLRDRY